MKKQVILCIALAFTSCSAMEQDGYDPEFYDQHSTPHHEQSLAALVHLKLDELPDGATIVELGCGTGKVSDKLAELHPNKKIVGIDSERRAVGYGASKYTRPNITLVEGSVHNFSLGQSLAHVVLGHHVLHRTPPAGIPSVFNTIVANMAEGGVLSVTTPAEQANDGIEAAVRTTLFSNYKRYLFTVGWASWQNNVTLLKVPEVTAYATSAGLQVISCEQKEQVAQFASADALAPWLKLTLQPFGLSKMSVVDQISFAREAAQLYVTEHNKVRDGVEYRRPVVHLIARKEAQTK